MTWSGTTSYVPTTYGFFSVAVPATAGVCALMRSARPDLGPTEVREAFEARFSGGGALDAAAAVRAVDR